MNVYGKDLHNMKYTPQHLMAIEEIEQSEIPYLREVLIEDGLESIKYTLWGSTGWDENYDPYVLGNEATEEQKRESWEIAIGMKKIMARVLQEEHERLVQEIEQFQADGPEVFYEEKRE